MPDYAEFLSVVANEQSKAVELSGSSIALLLTALGEGLENTLNWRGSGEFDELTQAEKDEVEAIVALAERELMTEYNSHILTGIVFASPADRTGALLCDGSQYNRVDYPDLYDFLVDTIYIVDADTFNVPDLTEVFILGSETVGGTGGEATHTLVTDEMPSHLHIEGLGTNVLQAGTGVRINSYAGEVTPRTSVQYTAPTGGDEPHNNMPPYHRMRYYIWT